ncbi:MAG: flagellar hook-length control protein FliK [Chloroflexi bacterium]|nr:flagellar hook-length control protein FliK [Chloroflexota bacterium]
MTAELASSSASLPVSVRSPLSAKSLPPDAFVALLLAQLSGESGTKGTVLDAAIAALAGSTVVDGAASADAPTGGTSAGNVPADADGTAATEQHGADPPPLLVDTAVLLALMGLQQVVKVPASGDAPVEGATATTTTPADGAVGAVSASAVPATPAVVPLVAGPSVAALAVPGGTRPVTGDGKPTPPAAAVAVAAVVDDATGQPVIAQPVPTQAAPLAPAGVGAELNAQGIAAQSTAAQATVTQAAVTQTAVAQTADPAGVAAATVAATGTQKGKPGRSARVAARPVSTPARSQTVSGGADPASTARTVPAERPGAQNSQPQANVLAFEAIVSGTGEAAQPSAPAEKHNAHESSPLPAMATNAKAAVPAKPAAAPVQEPAASFWRELARPITDQTAAGVRMALAQGGKEAHIRLQPESLGHLDIRVVLDGSNVQVHVIAEHAEVGQVIASHWTQLRETLATQGLQATNLAVSVGLGGNPRELAGRNAHHDGWQRDREEVTGIQDEGLDVTQSRPTLSASRHFLDGGRIEYWG